MIWYIVCWSCILSIVDILIDSYTWSIVASEAFRRRLWISRVLTWLLLYIFALWRSCLIVISVEIVWQIVFLIWLTYRRECLLRRLWLIIIVIWIRVERSLIALKRWLPRSIWRRIILTLIRWYERSEWNLTFNLRLPVEWLRWLILILLTLDSVKLLSD